MKAGSALAGNYLIPPLTRLFIMQSLQYRRHRKDGCTSQPKTHQCHVDSYLHHGAAIQRRSTVNITMELKNA